MRGHSENGISYSENGISNSESCSENTPELSESSENGLFAPRAFFPEIGVVPRLLTNRSGNQSCPTVPEGHKARIGSLPPKNLGKSRGPPQNPAESRKLANVSGLQKGPAERDHVKKRQKSSKSVKKFFDTFRQFSRRAKNVKNRQKVSKIFSTLFDNFRAAPVFRPLLGGSENGYFANGYFENPWKVARRPPAMERKGGQRLDPSGKNMRPANSLKMCVSLAH